jgi:hypothetical protein
MESTRGSGVVHGEEKSEERANPVSVGHKLPLSLAEAYNMERESYQKEIFSLDQMAEAGRLVGTLIKNEADIRASEENVLNERLQAVSQYLNASNTTTRQSVYLHGQAQSTARQQKCLLQQRNIRARLAKAVGQKSGYVEECANALISEADSIYQRRCILEADRHILASKRPPLEVLEHYAFQLSQRHYQDWRVQLRDEQISGLSLQEAGFRNLGNSMHREAKSLLLLQEDLVKFAGAMREEASGTELEEKSFELQAKAEEAQSSAELVVSWGTTSNALKTIRQLPLAKSMNK